MAAVSSSAAEPELASFGPLFHEFKLTLDSGYRTEAFSPFYYHEVAGVPGDQTRVWAVPPLFSYALNDDVDYEQFAFLWKGLTYNRYGSEYRLQIVQLLSFAGGMTQSETNVSRFTLFPLYFQQRSALPEKNYTALFPLYGTIRQHLFRDEIHFALFPLYGRSRKRDVVTDNFLYPVFHLRHGNSLRGWQVWPLVGHEHKEPTWRTNQWDELETMGGHEKQFVLWPFFLDHRTELGTTNLSHQQAVIPFYNYLRSPLRDSTSYLWPLGVTHTVDRQKHFTEWGAPWPLVIFAHGEGKTTRRVWPFFSHAHNATQTSRWYLWPVYKYNRLNSPPLDRERTRILFFLYSDTSLKDLEGGRRSRQRDLWPLFTARTELDGRRRLQLLSPLEPFLPNNTSVGRDLSPLWSIWRSEQNPHTQAASQSLFWNLYRHDTTASTKKCSLLFGLFQYQSDPDRQRWRLFYIPFGKKQPSQVAQAPGPR
jgi:hypothetical protein